MEIIFDKTEKTQGLIKISVNKTDFQSGVDQKIKEYSKTAHIKGFRQGKVPTGMIRKMYGKTLTIEEINKLVSERLNGYLREEDTHFLGEPLLVKTEDSVDWENQDKFEFKYEIGFAEPFNVRVDKKAKLEKYFIHVDDKVLDETIENLQRQFGKMETPEISSEKDTLYGEVKSRDKIVQEISIDLRDVEKNLLNKMTGIRIGTEVVIDPKKGFKHESVIKNQLRLNEDEFGKLKKLTFTVKAINHYQLAPVNQELFDNAFGKNIIEDEASFMSRVKEIVSQKYKGDSEQFLDHQIKEKLTESAKIKLPDKFLKNWLLESNENLTPDLLELEYSPYAKELKWSMVRDQIVKDQEIKVEHEDVMDEAKELIKKQFEKSGIGDQMNDQLANKYLQDGNGKNYMKVFNEVQSRKVLDHIKNEVTIKEKTISLDEFRKL